MKGLKAILWPMDNQSDPSEISGPARIADNSLWTLRDGIYRAHEGRRVRDVHQSPGSRCA
jgi:hypothetical protein